VVVDTITDAVVKTLAIDRPPLDLTFSPDRKQLYAAGGPLLQFRPLDVVGNTLQVRSSIRWWWGFFHSQHGSMTTIDVAHNSVVRTTLIDTATDRILRTVHLGDYAKSLAVSPDGRELYVILNGAGQGA
jgi:DNA-binding beta-propeller fold protein YncE